MNTRGLEAVVITDDIPVPKIIPETLEGQHPDVFVRHYTYTTSAY